MIFEQTLINTNFVGKEAFRWFLALTSGEIDQYNNYGTRAKIRILGYHGDEVEEKDLPWAHVLVPLTLGAGTHGSILQGHIKPSSLVVGFFADGNDGQQPVVVGAFYNGLQTEFPAKFSDGSKYFKLFQPDKLPINPYNIPVEKDLSIGIQTSTGATNSSGKGIGIVTPQAESSSGIGSTAVFATNALQETLNQNPTVDRPGHCRDASTGFSKILNALKNFISTLNTVNQVVDGFINPVLNKISNIDDEISSIGALISDWIINTFKQIRDNIINDIYDKFKKYLNNIKLPPFLEKIKQASVGELTDGIWCAFGKIFKQVKDYIIKFLFGLVGNIVTIPLCAVGSFIGSIIQTITNEISNAIGPILDQVSSIVGPIGTVISYVNQAIGYAKGLLSFLDCDSPECKDDQYDYEMNVGFIPKGSIEDFQAVINYSPSQGVSNLLNDATGNVKSWLGNFGGGTAGLSTELSGIEPLLSDCNIFSFECGPPTVNIFGGGGSGASGNVVVDSLGGILGVNITNPGSGYIEPPYVRFEDSCNNGRGAYGISNIDSSGQVTGVTIYYPGSGYLRPFTPTSISDDPCKVPPFDNTGTQVSGTINSVIIKNTGIGYNSSDKIYDAACQNDVEMYPDVDAQGRIVNVRIINPGTSINVTPNLQINSENGSGAVLVPSLIFKPIVGVKTETSREKVKSVVYCAEDHV